ncbi:MAG: hypothetical protein KC493_06390 [Bacteriovoracaceae bacterium]|nr:hypothetical protein [Bacteriovoracaceae bacterium]
MTAEGLLGKTFFLILIKAVEVEKWSRCMVSNTRVTKNKRSAKRVKAGKKRKAANNNKGTTPKFAIHLEK